MALLLPHRLSFRFALLRLYHHSHTTPSSHSDLNSRQGISSLLHQRVILPPTLFFICLTDLPSMYMKQLFKCLGEHEISIISSFKTALKKVLHVITSYHVHVFICFLSHIKGSFSKNIWFL